MYDKLPWLFACRHGYDCYSLVTTERTDQLHETLNMAPSTATAVGELMTRG